MIQDKEVCGMLIWKDGQDFRDALMSLVDKFGKHTVVGMIETTHCHVWFVMKRRASYDELKELYMRFEDRIGPFTGADIPVVITNSEAGEAEIQELIN